MRKVFFGPFRLEISPHPYDPNETILRLFCHDQPQPAERLQLRILKLLADEHPGEEVGRDQIAAAVWPTVVAPGLVQKQISLLRRRVLDDDRQEFIETFRDSTSYKFKATVRVEGELERLIALPKWDLNMLLDCLGKLTRNNEDDEDLRIVTCGLVPYRQDLPYDEYLDRGLRIRIVMMNGENEALMQARYGLRRDEYNLVDARVDFKNQYKYLQGIMSRFPAEALKVKLSNAMPSGLIFHSRNWALLGTFPAQGTYHLGPIIQATRTTSGLWKTLYEDWKVRWDDHTAIPLTAPALSV